MTFDRWVVNSWGRSGSVVVSEIVRNQLKINYNRTIIWSSNPSYISDGTEVSPYSILHTHSVNQVEHVQDCGLIMTIRPHSKGAISSEIARLLDIWHIPSKHRIKFCQDAIKSNNFNQFREIHQQIIDEHVRWTNRKDSKVECNIDSLNNLRNFSIEWHDKVEKTLLTRLNKENCQQLIIDYDKWSGDSNKLLKLLNFNIHSIDKLGTNPNLRSLSNQISNYGEVMDWLQLHHLEDSDFIKRFNSLSRS